MLSFCTPVKRTQLHRNTSHDHSFLFLIKKSVRIPLHASFVLFLCTVLFSSSAKSRTGQIWLICQEKFVTRSIAWSGILLSQQLSSRSINPFSTVYSRRRRRSPGLRGVASRGECISAARYSMVNIQCCRLFTQQYVFLFEK